MSLTNPIAYVVLRDTQIAALVDYEVEAKEILADEKANAIDGEHVQMSPLHIIPSGWKQVPIEAGEEQWAGIARDMIAPLLGARPVTPRILFDHLEALGYAIPRWLFDDHELLSRDHPISRSTWCTIIYRAMIESAPQPKLETES